MAKSAPKGEKRPSSTVPSRSAQKRAKNEPKKVVVDLTAEDDDPADNNNDHEKEYKVMWLQ